MLKSFEGLLPNHPPDEEQQLSRIRFTERNIVLPVKATLLLLLLYIFFLSNWFSDVMASSLGGDQYLKDPSLVVLIKIWEILRFFLLFYIAASLASATIFLTMERQSFAMVRRAAIHVAWLDALFAGALAAGTGGFDSELFWAFLFLIARNAMSHPNLGRQLALNGWTLGCYVAGGIVGPSKAWQDALQYLQDPHAQNRYTTEPFVLRLALLASMTLACLAIQILLDKRAEEAEAREQALRVDQLQTAGRLAAEIAHQLKNPLGIINTAAFTLRRTVKEGKAITHQIDMIREEVEKSDRILTELMGYARLAEGRVEKLDIVEEIESALSQVFPAAARYETKIERAYGAALPHVLMQRGHLSEIYVNLFQNAREAMEGKGTLRVTARIGENYSITTVIEDTGPGIAPEKLPLVFDSYFTTKERGTGLGLAIVKHNAEIYGGAVTAQSELGKGARFTVTLPAKAMMRIRK